MLVVFPAGEVSHWSFRHAGVADPEWSDTVVRLIRIARVGTLPVFFKGTNSVPFHLLGMIHPRLRTARLPHELLNKLGRIVELNIGNLIPYRTIEALPGNQDATRYLRWRTYLLSHRGESQPPMFPRLVRSVLPRKLQEQIAPETPPPVLLADLEKLRPEQCLEDSREYSVFLARPGQIPNVLRELGRLREISFRQVGEGTGREVDLDHFDSYYQHLFVWNKVKREISGAYRMGSTQEILSLFGLKGLYTSTLFHYNVELFRRIGPALELGRSFVRSEYQKQYVPLLLLWKGLGRYIAMHREIAVLFGAVSISKEYNPISRRLVAQFLEAQKWDDDLAKLIRPRHPFRPGSVRQVDVRPISRFFRDLDALAAPVADLETDGKGIPTLLRQYVKLGGKLAGFNLDPNFSEVLDGLILVDLRKTDPAVLDRYMGKEAAAAFLRHHRSLPLAGDRTQ